MVVLVVLALIVLRPHPAAMGAQVAVYLADLALLATLALPVIITARLRLVPSSYPALLIGLVTLAVGWVMALANLPRGTAPPDVVRFLAFGVYLILLIDRFSCSKLSSARVDLALDRMFWVVVVVALFQLLDPPVLGQLVRQIWGSDKLRAIWNGYPRIYATFFNANWFGVYLTFTAAHWIGRTITSGHVTAGQIGRGAVLVALLFLSGSRTGLVGTAVVVAAGSPWWLAALWRARVSRGVGVMLVVVVAGVAYGAQYLDVFGKLVDRYVAFQALLIEGQSDSSVSSRLSLWREGAELHAQRRLLGYGALPGESLPHNSYLTVALSMGLPTLLLTLGFATILVVQALVRVVLYRRSEDLTFVLFSLALAVVGVSGEYFYASQVVLLWLLALARSVNMAEPEPRPCTANDAHRANGGLPPQEAR